MAIVVASEKQEASRGAAENQAAGTPYGCLPCIVCHGRDARAALPAHPWLVKCDTCGLMRVHPAPNDDLLAEIYDEDYFRTFGYAEGAEQAYRAIRAQSAGRLLSLAERHFAVGQLLDVGSGLGDLLAEAMRRGWHAMGVEPNAWAANQADGVAPGATDVGGIEDFSFGEMRFDLVTCVDVIEHLKRPDEALRSLHSSLRPGGGLVMTTPNVGSVLARVLGAHWPHYHIDHLWYFNRATLTALVEQAGFEVLDWRPAPKIFNIAYVAGIFRQNAKAAWVRRAADGCLRHLPAPLLARPLPAIPEGQLIVAGRREC
ncbi:MAG TPA: class I SAM-dependent methyltransferase [Pirellulales bacterium]